MIRNLILDWSGTLVDNHETVSLLPHAQAFLKFCAVTGRRLYLLSAMQAGQLEAECLRLGVQGLFEAVYPATTDQATRFADVLRTHRLVATETAFVGSRIHDLEAAASAGVTSVAVLTGFDAAGPLASTLPDLAVRDLRVLQQIMEAGESGEGERIGITDLEVTTHIGVSPEEQAVPQKLWLDVAFEIAQPFTGMDDALERTVDYAAVAGVTLEFARAHRSRLIETFASRLADLVAGRFPVRRVEVTVRKVVLPNARHVFVRTASQPARDSSI